MTEFPHSERDAGSTITPWDTLAEARGCTETESRLLTLARKTMLSLWSYPNVYTDEGRSGKGAGKELCDLLVVFGNDVILFSDKCCAFQHHEAVAVAWRRWYTRAVERSANQLVGAEAWLKRFPEKVFLDKHCTKKLPVQIASSESCRFHLVAVANGSGAAAQAHWDAIGKGSSGSLILDTELVGAAHHARPFHVGHPLRSKKFVHVFDEITLNLVMSELDTISDFVNYLVNRESFLSGKKFDVLAMGEEELLATYLATADATAHDHRFPDFEPGTLFLIQEGEWQKLTTSARYKARHQANEISYVWDDLIEYQASHMIAGTSDGWGSTGTEQSAETVLRKMASESRVERRLLGRSIRECRTLAAPDKRYFRMLSAKQAVPSAYVFLALAQPPEQSYEEYREYRQYLAFTYCDGLRLRLPFVKEMLAIGMDPYGSGVVSVDFIHLRVPDIPLTADDKAEIEASLAREGIWNLKHVRTRAVPRANEFPIYMGYWPRKLLLAKLFLRKLLPRLLSTFRR